MKDFSIRSVGFRNYLTLVPGYIIKLTGSLIERYYHIIVIVAVVFYIYRILTSK